MSKGRTDECCPQFDPKPWDGATLTWERRRFVKDRVTSFLRIPLNYVAILVQVEKISARWITAWTCSAQKETTL